MALEVVEGMTADMTPVAFAAAKEMKEAVDQWNNAGGDMQSILDLLIAQNRQLVVALGKVELELGLVSGRITQS